MSTSGLWEGRLPTNPDVLYQNLASYWLLLFVLRSKLRPIAICVSWYMPLFIPHIPPDIPNRYSFPDVHNVHGSRQLQLDILQQLKYSVIKRLLNITFPCGKFTYHFTCEIPCGMGTVHM